nr:isoform 2 of adiponectin receptor protein [Quercus suber]
MLRSHVSTARHREYHLHFLSLRSAPLSAGQNQTWVRPRRILRTVVNLRSGLCFTMTRYVRGVHSHSRSHILILNSELAEGQRILVVSCHIVWNVSAPAAVFGNRLDFCGIVLLMWGASLPSIHFAFICDPALKQFHWLLVSLTACGCIIFTLHPQFLGPTFRKYRALMYTSFGLSAITFVVHGIFLYGLAVQKKRLALEWMALMAFLNIAGAAVYTSRVDLLPYPLDLSDYHTDTPQLPERWIPYRFDYLGASHQIFHILVLAAGLVHYKALACALYEVRGQTHQCAIESVFSPA